MSVGLSFLLVLPIPRGGSPLSRTISCSQILSNDWHVYRWCHICWVSFKIISHGMFLGPEKELGHLTPQGTQAMGLSLWSCYQWNHRWFMTMQDWRPDWPTVVDFDSLSPRLLLALKSSFSSNVSRSNPLPTNFLPHDRCNCVHVRRNPTSNHSHIAPEARHLRPLLGCRESIAQQHCAHLQMWLAQRRYNFSRKDFGSLNRCWNKKGN